LLDKARVKDRLSICFGHIPGWKSKRLVNDVKDWTLQRLKDIKQFCYVAYHEGEAAGFVEFLPLRFIQKFKMNPCRMHPSAMPSAEYKEAELSQIPYPNPIFSNDVFISCLWVDLSFTRRGIGTMLIERLLHDLKEGNILPNSKGTGVQVYIEKRRPDWHPSIDWPAGGVGFYEKLGFVKIRNVKTLKMTGWVMRKTLESPSNF
jgi:ribosomal protein S18 acetylase RimI-like enzyme